MDLLTFEEAAGNGAAPEWIIEGLLPSGAVIMAAGPPKKTRKTVGLTAMALAVARGEPFADRRVISRPAIYSYLEDGPKRVGYRLQQFGIRPDADVASGAFATCGTEGFHELRSTLLALNRPVLWIIDPLVIVERLHGVKDENNAAEIEAVLGVYRDFVQRTDSTVVITHHFRKDGMTKRGSTALDGSTDGWYDMLPQGHGVTKVLSTLRDGEDAEIWLKIDTMNVPWSVSVTEPIEEEPKRGRKRKGSDEESEGRGTKLTPDVLAEVSEIFARTGTIPVSKAQVATSLGIGRRLANAAVDELLNSGVVATAGTKYVSARV